MEMTIKRLITLSILVFVLFNVSYAKELVDHGVIMNPIWERESKAMDQEYNACVYSSQYLEKIFALVSWNSVSVSDNDSARSVMSIWMKKLNNDTLPKEWRWRDVGDKLVLRSDNLTKVEGRNKASNYVLIWDGLRVRSIVFEYDSYNDDISKLPEVCEGFVLSWLYPGGELDLNKAVKSALLFQSIAVGASEDTLFNFTSAFARNQFDTFNKALGEDPVINGWRRLISESVVVPVGGVGMTQLVGFYHPWSDTSIITVWEYNDVLGIAHIREAYLFDGSFMYLNEILQVGNTMPAWRFGIFAPLDLCNNTTTAVMTIQYTISRTIALVLENQALYQGQMVVAGVKFLSYILNIAELYKDPKVLSAVAGILTRCIEKDKTLLSGENPEVDRSMQILIDSKNDYLKSLEPRGYIKTANDGAMVFLAGHNQSLFIVMVLSSGDKPKLEKLDLLWFDDAVRKMIEESEWDE